MECIIEWCEIKENKTPDFQQIFVNKINQTEIFECQSIKRADKRRMKGKMFK